MLLLSPHKKVVVCIHLWQCSTPNIRRLWINDNLTRKSKNVFFLIYPLVVFANRYVSHFFEYFWPLQIYPKGPRLFVLMKYSMTFHPYFCTCWHHLSLDYFFISLFCFVTDMGWSAVENSLFCFLNRYIKIDHIFSRMQTFKECFDYKGYHISFEDWKIKSKILF